MTESNVDAAAPAVVRRTPEAWGELRGNIQRANPDKPWLKPNVDWRHAAADALHGWSHHRFHFQDKNDAFEITEADYNAALEAGAEFPLKPEHTPAVAPFCPHPPTPPAPKKEQS